MESKLKILILFMIIGVVSIPFRLVFTAKQLTEKEKKRKKE